MIMAKNPDETYSQVGFIKDSDGNDTEYIYDKDGTVLFEKGFNREKSGSLPLQLGGIGKPLKNYTIYGNTLQNGTPTPDNPVEVQAVGDRTGNLFNIDNITHEALSADGSTSFSSAMNLSGLIAVNGDFTVSWDAIINGAYMRISTYDENKNFIEHIGTINTYNDRSYTNAHVGYIRINYENHYQLSQVQVNLGSEALPYEPYGYKIPFTTAAEDGTESITTPIYLDKPLYKNGGYADTLCYSEQKVERYIKEIVLTGDEDWQLQSINDNGIANFFMVSTKTHTTATNLMCTHFIQQKTMIANTTTEGIFNANGNAIYIRIKQERASTVTDFKAWLAEQYNNGTPVKVYYILATPETESVTLPKIPTLDGTTVIDVETEIKPSKMDIKYKSKN